AHRTFEWTSEAPLKAAVHCVIVGFTKRQGGCRLFDYVSVRSAPNELATGFINAYLVDGPNVLVEKRMKPLSPSLPEIESGSKAVDWGYLTIEEGEIDEVRADPVAKKYIRPYLGGDELINNIARWCLWLEELDPKDIRKSKLLADRVAEVQSKRAASKKAPTRAISSTPHLFGERRQPSTAYLGIPQTFSESRRYATAARLPKTTIASIKLFTAPDQDGYLFAIISSSMFIVWQKTVGGRLKSDPSFSNTLVWNNLPLPLVGDGLRSRIIAAGQAILEARESYPQRSLAEHYNPLSMDAGLVAAHDNLDRLVDSAFGAKRTCASVRERQNILFARYQEMTDPLGVSAEPKATRTRRTSKGSKGK
ncbi:MAG: hypothetical protein KC457_21805, partial [Myxococcales bacterium]|nr:hypothetical protein [Myxococcales bacterium]